MARASRAAADEGVNTTTAHSPTKLAAGRVRRMPRLSPIHNGLLSI